MSHQQIDCRACGQTLTVDDTQESARCSSCGSKHAAPWDDPTVLSSPLSHATAREPADAGADAEPQPATDGGEPLTLDVDGGTVEIIIRVNR